MSNSAGELALPGGASGWSMTRVDDSSALDGEQIALADRDDRRLVRACRDGDQKAFASLVERHQRRVYQLCFRFTGNQADAADLTQEVFLRAFRGIARFRGDSSVSTWLYRIGVNVCLNHVGSRRTPALPIGAVPEPVAALSDPAAELARAEQAARVRAAVAALPARQRAAVVLRVYQGLSHREIAAALRTTEGASKANLFHALRNLRRRLSARSS